ncbi:MAG: hypothetical protein J7K12_03910 [Thermoplasmata archaeon]|nr:hypothetical protein [Thermoplasmata archaeon]
MSKPIGVRIDSRQEEIWLKFKEFVEEKYGKKHTVLGNELVRALQLYLDLYQKASKNNFESHIIKKKAGEIEIKSLKEISYDLLNTLIAISGYAENLEEEIKDEGAREKIRKIKDLATKSLKMLQERIEGME